jgi:hypothetical protein
MTEVITRTVSNHSIPVTQFLRPSGIRQRIFWFTRSDVLACYARTIIKRGFEFQMEVLRTGEVSMTVTDPSEGGADLHVEVVKNHKGMTDEAMERLIAKAHQALAKVAS